MALLRTSGSVEAPTYDGEDQHDLLTIRIHYGGALLRSPYIRYVGKGLDYFDYVDVKCLSIDVLRQFIVECIPLCDRDIPKLYHKYNDDWDKGCRFLSKDSDMLVLLKFSKTGNEVEIYVQHGDLDDMLRAEATAGEIRQDNVGDDEGNGVGEIQKDSYGSVNVDEDVDQSGPFSHTELFSNAIHEQLRDSDRDTDLNCDSDGLWSHKESSDVEGDPSKLDTYPKFNPKT
ncbi:hypothetical protein LIER_34523 [Lithospermum erythrorhizon]|uniref:PB1-like domain-containing protein n=1 Tax=Lithospermum erythrorhizon TaxID=34254 RepID=A0AAV3S2S2_LITER